MTGASVGGGLPQGSAAKVECGVPKVAVLAPLHGSPIRGVVSACAPTSIWVTGQALPTIPFREPVEVSFVVDGRTVLRAPFEVIAASPAGVGLELTRSATPEAREALAAWAAGNHVLLTPPAEPAPRTPTRTPTPRPSHAQAHAHGPGHLHAPDHTTLLGHRVLVVEDDPEIAQMFEHFLTRRGAEVRVHRDGKSALDYLEAGAFDTVLLDWMLPKVSGKTLLEQLKSKHAGVKVAVVSGVISHAHTKTDLLHLGADAVFAKPVQIADIARWIAHPTAMNAVEPHRS